MKILSPPGVLVADGSLWNDHINPQELIDGGVVSVILGLYRQWDGSKFVLNTNCKRILGQLKNSSLIVQTYSYFYPQWNPTIEANWYIDQILSCGVSVTFSWADCENAEVVMDENVRSEKYRQFTDVCASRFPNTGVYTNKSFILDHAPQMDLWIGKYKNWVPHYGNQPKVAEQMTWETLKSKWLPNYDIILSKAQKPEIVVGHQFTGDVCILPGFYNAQGQRMSLDVSVFKPEFIASLGNYVPLPPPPPPPTNLYVVNVGAVNVRGGPSTSYPILTTLPRYTQVTVWGEPSGGYSRIDSATSNRWVFTNYLTKV